MTMNDQTRKLCVEVLFSRKLRAARIGRRLQCSIEHHDCKVLTTSASHYQMAALVQCECGEFVLEVVDLEAKA